MKTREKKIALVLAVALAMLQGFFDTYTWTGGSGIWSDPSHWTGGPENDYPNARGDIAKFPVNTEPITI